MTMSKEKDLEPEKVEQKTDQEITEETSAEDSTTVETEQSNEQADKVKQLEKTITTLQQQLADKEDNLLRMAAETQNLQRRLQRDLDNTRKFSNEKIIKALIPVMDSFDKALEVIDDDNCEVTAEAMIEGTQNTQKIFTKVLTDNGIEIVDPQGEAFNPEQHEAMSIIDSPEHDKNTVVSVFQKGYLLNGRVVRAAMVVVAK